jgi:hypothetical protein
VSKAWRDLIANPDNRKKLPQAMQGLFVQTSEVEDSEVDDDELERISFSFIDLTVMRSVPMDIDPCFPFLTEMTGSRPSSWIPATGLSFSSIVRSHLIPFTIPCATQPQSNGQSCPLAALVNH